VSEHEPLSDSARARVHACLSTDSAVVPPVAAVVAAILATVVTVADHRGGPDDRCCSP